MEVVDVVLDNRSAVILTHDADTMRKLWDWWSYFYPGARFAPSYKLYTASMRAIALKKASGELAKNAQVQPSGWDGRIRLLKHGTVPAGLFRATHKTVEQELDLKFHIKTEWPEPPHFVAGFDAGPGKYAYQDECVAAMCRVMRRGGGIVLAATASGKTRMCASFFSKVPSTIRLFVVDQLNLLYQAQKELAETLDCPVGVVGDSEFLPEIVTVATIQTLDKHSDKPEFRSWYETIDIMVVDELHEQMAKRNFSIVEQVRPMAVYGLTATLEMNQKDVRMRAHAFAGPVIFRFPVEQGIEEGVLNKGMVLQLQFEAVDAYADNYHDEYKIQVSENEVKQQAAKLITQYLLGEDRYVLQLVTRVAHLDALDTLHRSIPHALAFGGVKKNDREENIEAFESGAIKLMIANVVFKKGVNIKRVDAALDMAEMKSKNDALQKFGRLLRLHADKHTSLYIDFTTQGDGRFALAGRSRMRVFRQAGIPIQTAKVATVKEAVEAVVKCLKKMES